MTSAGHVARFAVTALALSITALTAPRAASAFSTFAHTGAVSVCTTLAPRGGDTFGDSLLAAIAPAVLPTAGSCGGSSDEFSASASAMIGTGAMIVTSGSPLAFGQLRVSVDTSGPATANALARIEDQLTIIPTSGFTEPGFLAIFTLVSHGTLGGEAFAGGGLAATSFVESRNDPAPALCTGTPDLCAGATVVSPGVETQTIHVTIAVPTVTPVVFFRAELFAASNPRLFQTSPSSLLDGAADFSNTAVLSLTLPAGFTFVSGSGIVTSDRPGATVPEPAVLALLASGLVGLGVWPRRPRS